MRTSVNKAFTSASIGASHRTWSASSVLVLSYLFLAPSDTTRYAPSPMTAARTAMIGINFFTDCSELVFQLMSCFLQDMAILTTARHPSAGRRLRHPHRARTPGAQGRSHDDDLHPCSESRRTWRPQSSRRLARRALTINGLLRGNTHENPQVAATMQFETVVPLRVRLQTCSRQVDTLIRLRQSSSLT